MKDYYKILHVTPNASSEEIAAAYKRLSEEYKPQEHYPKGSYAIRYYKDIQEAYKILSDPIKRSTYTQELAANRDNIEDLEKKQREEGFGDVLKLLLNDPKAKPKRKKSPHRKPSSRNGQSSNLNKPMLIVVVVIVLLALGIVSLLNLDKEKIVAPIEVQTKETSGNVEKKSLLEESLYGSGEEGYKDEDKASESSPYELEDKVSEEMASYSLQDCFQLLSNDDETFEKKEDAIARALQFFSGNNANVIVLSNNDIQIRRETVEDYLFILMLQGYTIDVVHAEKDKSGKITQLSVKEIL